MTDQSSVISMWAFITSWFSPTASLFLLLNIVIGTVAFNFRSQKKSLEQKQEQGQLGRDDSTQLARAPSLVERVKSFNLSSLYRSDSQNSQPEYEPAVDQRPAPQEEKSCRVCEQRAMRGKSDNGREAPARQAEKMKKSASERSMVTGHLEFEEEEEEEELERRRPATTRMEKTGSFGGGDEEVDGKADDFISRFRQQQRLDYLLL